ncbi:MAG: T9SS type A sorting domain-containing protein [Rhodothermus sp.]|nr:T9SS type A sorting domain-containing protein [Rhodothermus sp.]
MKKRYHQLGTILIGLLLSGGSVQAQFAGFEVVASDPAPGAVSVPLETIISFTFSTPLPDSLLASGLDSLLGAGFGVHPCDQILVGGVSPCTQPVQGTINEEGRTISFAVTHLAQTTYTWTVPELIVSDTAIAFRTYFLKYATAEVLGGVTVQGSVMLAGMGAGKVAWPSAKHQTHPDGWVSWMRTLVRPHVPGWDRLIPSLMDPVVQAAYQPNAYKQGASEGQQVDPTGMIVVLLDRYGYPAGGAVVTAEGTFRIANVEQGWYTPQGILLDYDRVNGRLRVGFAMLDEDMDGQADSIQVNGSDISGVVLTGQGIELLRITALQQLEAAGMMAASMLEGPASLIGIAAASLPLFKGEPDGKALLWIYLFAGSGTDPQILLLVQGSPGTLVPLPLGSVSTLNLPVPLAALPDVFVDSDVAVAAAEAGGGTEFRAMANNEVVMAMLAGIFGPLSEMSEFVYSDPNVPVWVVAYLRLDRMSYLADSLTGTIPAKQPEVEVGRVFYVDMQDGTLLGSRSMVRTTSVEPLPGEVPRQFALEPNYPNPFRTETAIPFTLARSSPVRVEVFNLLGQRVATLFEGVLPAGRYVVRWVAADQPAGFYLVRLQAGERQLSRVVMHQR